MSTADRPPTSINETNTMTVRYVSDNSRVGVVGGGFTRDQSSRWGIRADLRAHIQEDVSRTQLDAFSRIAVGTPEVQVAFNSNPTIAFSNITGGFFSSQQTPLREFRASEGSGIQIRLQASFGLYRRF